MLNLIPGVLQWKGKVYLQFTVHYILFRVLSFRSYDLCPSFTQQINSTPVEIFAFLGDPFIDTFFDIFKRLEMLWWQIILNGSKGMIIYAISGEYGGCDKTSQFMSHVYFFTGSAICGRALSWIEISLSWRLAYPGRFFSMLGSVSSIIIYSEQL